MSDSRPRDLVGCSDASVTGAATVMSIRLDNERNKAKNKRKGSIADLDTVGNLKQGVSTRYRQIFTERTIAQVRDCFFIV